MARSRTGEDHNQYPLFQLWIPRRNQKYERVYESSSSEGVFTMADSESEFTVGEYIPDDPVPFEAGYLFGVYPGGGASSSRLSVRYASVPSGYGYLNYCRRSGMSLEEFDKDGSSTGNDYPLVAVNTGENQLTFSDKSEAYEPPALCHSGSVLSVGHKFLFFEMNQRVGRLSM